MKERLSLSKVDLKRISAELPWSTNVRWRLALAINFFPLKLRIEVTLSVEKKTLLHSCTARRKPCLLYHAKSVKPHRREDHRTPVPTHHSAPHRCEDHEAHTVVNPPALIVARRPYHRREPFCTDLRTTHDFATHRHLRPPALSVSCALTIVVSALTSSRRCCVKEETNFFLQPSMFKESRKLLLLSLDKKSTGCC
ncbi:uncharacterized protein LOC110268406 [Arachis ipaensis]|uniref:uncharacterized protein LOC110268406 n=1 Tax=Arachis ipaensis TaxID=130454 RepID=UPI000A2B6FE5|nr:uncharacterized protein LOC110268406 [Arachis ipaensis]